MAIGVRELIDKYNGRFELDKSESIAVTKLENYIDKEIEIEYTQHYNDSFNFKPDGFKCNVYLKTKAELVMGNFTEVKYSRVKLFLLRSYTDKGWEISGANGWDWKFKFNLAELRERNIEAILEDD